MDWPDEKFRILSIDGGGMRGYIACRLLMAIEELLANAGRPPLVGNVRLIAGTSSGAVVGCGLATGLSPQQAMEFYTIHRDRVFPRPPARWISRIKRAVHCGLSAPRYDARDLRWVLKEVLGDRPFGDCRPNTMAVAYDSQACKAFVAKSWRDKYAALPVWQVVAGSCAAPGYFEPQPLTVDGQQVTCVDGGVVANDPEACAAAEGLKLRADSGHQSPLLVVSVGTGLTPPSDYSYQRTRCWGMLQWASSILNLMLWAADGSHEYIGRTIVQADGGRVIRFQPPISSMAIDDSSDEAIAGMEMDIERYLQGDGWRHTSQELLNYW